MMIVGLTGSIGMGKTTTAGFFRDEGIAVNDADAVVHDLYRGEAVAPIGAAFPGSITDGMVDRRELSRQLAENPANFRRLEAIVHPLVRARENKFLETGRRHGAAIVVLDIPLLFETGGEDRVDVIVVASCAPEIQRQRVLARPGMTEEKLAMIIARQVPDGQKRARADFIIDTGQGMDAARTQVRAVIDALQAGWRREG